MSGSTQEICTKVLRLGESRQCTLTYYITMDDDLRRIPSIQYGVGIRRNETGEDICFRSITPDRASADRLLDLLASNFVTPMTLCDSVYDWLCM